MSVISKLFKSSYILTVLAVLSFFACSQYALFFTGNFGNIIEEQKLQSGINQVIADMDELEKELPSLPDNYLFFEDDFLKTAEDKQIHVFVYKNDSLLVWSDNEYLIGTEVKTDSVYVEQLQNGFVLSKSYCFNQYTYRLSYPLLRNYTIENEYLKSQLNPSLGIRKQLTLTYDSSQGKAYYSPSGIYLISGIWETGHTPNSTQHSILFTFYILGIVFLLVFFKNWIRECNLTLGRKLAFFILATILTIAIQQYLQKPTLIFNSPIFSPTSFASSYYFSSLGSLFINSLGGLFVLIAILDYLNENPRFKVQNVNQYYLGSTALMLSLFFLLILVKTIVSDLIFNSTISFNLSHISNINYLSIIGLIALGIWIYAFYILLIRGNIFFEKPANFKASPWRTVSIVGLLTLAYTIAFRDSDYVTYLFFLFIVSLNLILKGKTAIKNLTLNTLYLLAFAFLFSIWFNVLNSDNEHIKRKALIQNLAINQDPQAEYLFSKIAKQIYGDEYLIAQFQSEEIYFDSITNYIENQYFKQHSLFDKYDFQTTICSEDFHLILRPQNIEVLCDTFFYENLIQYGILTADKNLYRLDYGSGQISYLGLLRFYQMTNDGYIPYTVYIEINSKLRRQGYTSLLSAQQYDPFEKIADYSLASYENGKRVEVYGKFAYPEYFSWTLDENLDFNFLEHKNYNHLVYSPQESNKTYVLSLEIPPALAKVSPFSYLFILYGILFVLLRLLSNFSSLKFNVQFSFAGRLQIAMVSIILISFAVISTITIFYIQKLNENKNHFQLENLAIALQTEFEHKLSNEEDLSLIDPDYLSSLLIKFSKVFDTDINIYQLDGHLLSTTRKEIFQHSLLSDLINPYAYNYLKKEHQSLYIAKENIGSLVYSSAYLPFHNRHEESIAFLNLPYFAREEVLQAEVSGLLIKLMNVYTLITVISILVILFVSNYISRPMSMLKRHFQEVRAGKSNRKIQWKGIEEIHTLVEEYNRMIDALALSSEKLAKSERESAWREMAKQVAHEIKNPLTPMKLSVQYMMRVYDQENENPKERLQSLSNTLIEQIDTLSDIASAFSDFANMPKSMKQNQEMNSIVRTASALFTDYENVHISIEDDKTYLVFVDKGQWIRVFNNLIKNSIQAVDEHKEVKINIRLSQKEDRLLIEFSDNGRGIPVEMKKLIFTPKFTTKTTGTGLGLAMVKNIVDNSDGQIHFESFNGNGAKFFIEIPLQS